MKKMGMMLTCFFVAAGLLSGCSDFGTDGLFQEKQYTADSGAVQAIRLDVRDREVLVSLSEDEQIHIGYCESGREFYDFAVSEEKALTMTLETKKEWSDYIGGKTAAENRIIHLQLPVGLLTSLTIATTNGNITLPPLTLRDGASLRVNNGDIQFERLEVGQGLELEVKNGDIRGTLEGGYDDFAMACEVKKGTCNLPAEKTDGGKSLKVALNNGDADITFE